jgi:hypothetical protein
VIRMTIEIDVVVSGSNEFGAGVNVQTDPFVPHQQPQAVGATWCGICMAINEYMRSRGVPNFDCMVKEGMKR